MHRILRLTFTLAMPLLVPALLLAQTDEDIAAGVAGAGACAACWGFLVFIVLGIIALNIGILVFVVRDAKNRGMENAVLWLIVILISGPIGLIVYFLSRPKGELVACRHCSNRRMAASATCPHCGNA